MLTVEQFKRLKTMVEQHGIAQVLTELQNTVESDNTQIILASMTELIERIS